MSHDTGAIPDFSRGADGLLPAIAQDAENGQVLMMAWMNQEAWRETVASRRAVYYSRSRGKLWRKGEESGHQQQVQEIRVDCDADTILLLVHQKGAACHEGFRTCFFRKVEASDSSGSELNVSVVEERLRNPDDIYGSK